MDIKKILELYPDARSIALSSPSGGGKSTIIKYLQSAITESAFSVSATTRLPRNGEIDGRDYYFISEEKFKKQIRISRFLEWEEVYPGIYYGTPLSELERLWSDGKLILFDIDVKGALNLKQILESNILTIFLKPPSISILKERLLRRGTENAEQIEKRIARAEYEIKYSEDFDAVVSNWDLEETKERCLKIVELYIKEKI